MLVESEGTRVNLAGETPARSLLKDDISPASLLVLLV